MRWKSSGDRYGAVAMMIHWLTAFAVIGLLISGLIMADAADGAAKKSILMVHAPMGTLVLLLTVLRIGWWAFADRRPVPAQADSRLQAGLAKLVHIAFYPLLLVLGGSGLAMMILSGAPAALLGDAPLPNFWEYAPRGPHGIAAFVLMGLAALHIAGALYHQFIKRDGLLTRMGLFAWPKAAPAPERSRAGQFSASS